MSKSLIFLFAFCFLISEVRAANPPDGYVVKVESSTVYLDWGIGVGVQVGDQFKLYRTGETLKHPVTGEVLGKASEDAGQGVIQQVEEKFSVGQVIESKGALKVGDRTRYIEASRGTDVSVSPVGVVPATASGAAAGGLKELYRSDAIPHEAVGLAFGDVDGDGKKDVVVAYKDQVEVFRWNGQKLESLTVFKGRGYNHYLSVETADLEKTGHDTVFVTAYLDGIKRARTLVLEWANGALQEGAHVDGFVRAFTRTNGERQVLWQGPSMSREFRVRAPAPLVWEKKKFREGDPIALPRAFNSDQLFGYAWGDYDGDGSEDLALLQNGERLRLFFKDAKWTAGDRYGGTLADFTWENDQSASVFPRLLTWAPGGSAHLQLLVPHNIQYTPIRLTRLKIYHESEIVGLAWNGLEMAKVWTLHQSGATVDLGISDVQGRGTPQLWTALLAPGDKTVLLAYQLP